LFCYKLRIRGNTYPEIARQFALQFPTARVPHRNTVSDLVDKMEDHKVLINRHRENSGRHRDERSDENVLRVYESWMDDPQKSIRARARELQDVTRSTIQRILRLDLKLYPYLITRRHGLEPRDYPIRVQFADWFLAQHNTDTDFVNNIWWTDESHIHLNGYVNTHNAIHWGSQRPTAVVPIRRFPEKVTVWCAISSYGVLGPYYYEQNGQNVTVNGIRYHDMLERKFIPDLFNFCLQHDLDPLEMWFQQDGARPHIVNSVRQYLQHAGRFGGRTIGDRLDHHWPARSPDLTVCDFFLWGYMKDEIAKKGLLRDRAALKTAVEDVVWNMNPQMCTAACHSVLKRLHILKLRGGRHIEQTL
jgi:hypothetical protein